jgi:predicted transcriptional regulator
MGEPSGHEFERILFRRRDVLGAISGGTGDKRALVEQLDIPRSTLDDVVRELSDAGLVRYVDGEWEPTTVGQCAAEIHEAYAERIAGLADAAAVLEASPGADVGAAMLDGCTGIDADGALLDRTVTAFLDQVRAATEIRGLVPQALAGPVPSIHEEVVGEPRMTTELVFDPTVYEELIELYPEQIGEALSNERVRFYRASIPVDYGLWIADDEHAGIVVYGSGGVAGIILNDTTAAVDWAAETYDRVRDRAEPIPPSEGSGSA